MRRPSQYRSVNITLSITMPYYADPIFLAGGPGGDLVTRNLKKSKAGDSETVTEEGVKATSVVATSTTEAKPVVADEAAAAPSGNYASSTQYLSVCVCVRVCVCVCKCV